MTMGRSEHHSYMMGGAEGDGEHLTRDEAEKWVRGMKSEDGKTGGRWPLHEIKQYAGNFGIHGEEEVVEFFAVMNALYTDYCKVAKKYGVDFAVVKDKNSEPPVYTVFFKAKDQDAITNVIKEYTAKKMLDPQKAKPSVLAKLAEYAGTE